jgi:hypothetical protein
MGTFRFIDDGTGRQVGLYDHEGYLEYRLSEPLVVPPMFTDGEPTRYEGWTSTWVDGIEERRCAVRAACDCGWRGPELPWPGPAATPWGAEPTDEQHDALMLVWDRHMDTLIAHL